MSETRPLDAVVVGMGIAGLSCLWRLRAGGLDAVGLEAGDRAGGVIRSLRAEGFLAETGPNTVPGTPELIRLVEELALESELLRADPRLPRFVFRGGELHPVPMTLRGLAATKLLSARGKLRLLGEMAVGGRRDAGEETVADFVTRRFGRDAFDAFVQPMLSGTFAGAGDRLSTVAVFPSLVDMEARSGSVIRALLTRKSATRPPPVSFREGFEALPRRLAERLAERIQTGVSVEAVRAGGAGIELAVRDRGRERRLSSRALVLALPPWAAEPILRAAAPEAASALAEIEAPPLAVVSVTLPRSEVTHPLRGFGFLAARDAGVRMIGCVWPSSIFPGRAPVAQVLLTCFVGGATDTAAADLDEASLVSTVRRDLEKTLRIRAAPRVVAIDRYTRSIPQYTLGHPARLARVRRALERLPGLFLAGNALAGISVGDVALESERVASKVTTHLRPRNVVDFPPLRV